MKRLIIPLLAGALLVGGCAQNPTNEQAGSVIGGVLGGVLGSNVGGGHGNTAATIVGTIAGAYIGAQVGRYMDDTDRLKTAQALETSRTDVPTSWHNPDSGYNYTVTPTKTYQEPSGQYCREFTTVVKVGGQDQKAYGTACRQPDGNWKIVSQQ